MILYKYVSNNLWNKILPNKVIRFTQPSLFNDPFEMQPFYESLANVDEVKSQLTVKNVENILKNQFNDAYKNLSPEAQNLLSAEFINEFAKVISPFAVEQAPTIIDKLISSIGNNFNKGFGTHIGVLSLTEKPDNLLMWAHYAQDHKGFVIGFDSEKEYFHQQRSEVDEFYYLRKVKYSENRPKIQLTSAEDAADVFLTKSKEWEYEQEWRMLKPIGNADEIIKVNDESICLFSFPAECITEIIIGCRMVASEKKGLLEYLASDEQFSHVGKYEAILDEKEFKLNIIPTVK